MENVMGRIHSLESCGTLDGPGLRCVIFLQGCAMRCLYCHNPDSWSIGGGEVIGSEQLVQDVLSYRSFISSGGVTLSGGEPLLQPEFALSIMEGCREHGLHTALDTAGGVPLKRCAAAVSHADLLLLDIKAGEPEMFRQITGMGMEHTLEVLNLREQEGKPVWIRHVLVPELTLDDAALHTLGALIGRYKCVERVELLPFHKMGEYKWQTIGMNYTLGDVPPPNAKQISHAASIISRYTGTVV